MTESRQVRRALERQKAKARKRRHALPALKGGPSIMLIHRNRKHREDGQDYFK